MTSIALQLTDEQAAAVRQQADQSGFQSLDEYISHLIREEQKRRELARLEAEIRLGLESGSAELKPEDWDSIRAEGLRLVAIRRGHNGTDCCLDEPK